MRVVYCLDSINYVGGIQKVTVTKANALAREPGNEVWVIVADNSGRRVFELLPCVHFIDLAVNYYEDDWMSRWNVLKCIIVKRRLHKRRLTGQLRQICPDVVISVGQSEKNFLPRIIGEWVTIREFRYTRDYRKLMADGFFSNVVARFSDLYERLFSLPKYNKIVVQTYEDKQAKWNNSNRVSVIHNPLDATLAYRSLLSDNKVIAIGRLTYQKNFTSLIRAYSIVAKRFPDWMLDIYGDGAEKQLLAKLIADLSLNRVVRLDGLTAEALKHLLQSSIFVLSSRFEGMPNVMLEAMSGGLPVVSYACPCGPKDIITDGVDGFLVPVGDEKLLADRICRLIEDKDLRKRMGAAALERSKDFAIEKIIPMWMELFADLVRQKRQG